MRSGSLRAGGSHCGAPSFELCNARSPRWEAVPLAPNMPAFRTTPIYPLLSAPTGIRSIPPPEVHRGREERWRGWRLGGEVTGVSSLEVVVGEAGCSAPLDQAAGILSGAPHRGRQEPARAGRAGRAARKNFLSWSATLRGRPPLPRPQVAPLAGRLQPPLPRLAPRTPASGRRVPAAPQHPHAPRRVLGFQRSAPPPAAGVLAAGVQAPGLRAPLCCPWRPRTPRAESSPAGR